MTSTLLALLLALTATPGAPPDTVRSLRITVLDDVTTTDPRLRPGWGFAALIEVPGHALLLDSGAPPDTLLPNMDLLHVPLPAIEAIALSHAHGDHAGGLPALAARGVSAPVYALPGLPAELLGELARGFTVREVAPGQELIPGVFTTGEMIDPAVGIPEQSFVIPTDSGLVIVTGCAHPGIVAIVQRAVDTFHQPVYLVMGGFHLMQQTEPQVQETIAGLRRLGVRKVGAAHCTGEGAVAGFAAAWGSDFVPLGVGRVVTVGAGAANGTRGL